MPYHLDRDPLVVVYAGISEGCRAGGHVVAHVARAVVQEVRRAGVRRPAPQGSTLPPRAHSAPLPALTFGKELHASCTVSKLTQTTADNCVN